MVADLRWLSTSAVSEPTVGLLSNEYFEIFRRAATHSRVLLMGFGGDPLLYPSPSYWGELMRRGRIGEVCAALWQCVRRRRRPALGLRSRLRAWLGRTEPLPSLPAWINPGFASRLDLHLHYATVLKTLATQSGRREMVDPYWSGVLASSHPGNNAFAVQCRFPFFDVRLLSFLVAVSPIPWFESKTLLREAMRGLLPEAVRQRPKTLLRSRPYHTLACKQGAPPWLVDYPATPVFANYVDDTALQQSLQAPRQMPGWKYEVLTQPVALAYWLHHRVSRLDFIAPPRTDVPPASIVRHGGRPLVATHEAGKLTAEAR
jgi:asparagine synthase (glutamine-hydrolysing)